MPSVGARLLRIAHLNRCLPLVVGLEAPPRALRLLGTTAARQRSERSAGYSGWTVGMAAAAGTLGGVLLSSEDARLRSKVLPSTGLRTCCDAQPLSEAQRALPSKLQKLVGREHVSTSVTLKGSRLGQGTAMAVVKPGSISEAIAVLEACVAADVAVLPQGANTGLTGGSVPRDDASDRPNVVINMRRLNKILPLGADGHQVLCFGGAGIFDLQEKLKNEYNRDSHSVLGSIFLNPSVAAGVSFGSGGTQIRKGPAFTERALFCRVTADSKVELVDTLGLTCQGRGSVALLDEATGSIASSEVDPAATRRPASWPKYAESLMKLDAQVSRFNADTRGLDCNRSEGKVMILATVHDTFPFPVRSRLAWASCRDFTTAQALKREVGISSSTCMAKSCEYMNRETYDTVDQAGRILIKMIEVVGMRNLEPLWNLKLFIESLPIPLATIICDKFLWWFNNILPKSLPAELEELAKEFDHHVLMEFAEYSNGEVDSLVERLKRFQASRPEGDVKFHFCDDDFGKTRATLFRFAVAPAFRTLAIGKGQQGLSIDYALPKNFAEIPTLPEDKYPIQTRLIYSHFGCNVYHEDFVFGNDIDVHAAKKAIKKAVESIGGKLPAEHGHGTEYAAPEDTKARWMKTDPSNVMNPGVGGTSFKKNYAPCDCCHSH